MTAMPAADAETRRMVDVPPGDIPPKTPPDEVPPVEEPPAVPPDEEPPTAPRMRCRRSTSRRERPRTAA